MGLLTLQLNPAALFHHRADLFFQLVSLFFEFGYFTKHLNAGGLFFPRVDIYFLVVDHIDCLQHLCHFFFFFK